MLRPTQWHWSWSIKQLFWTHYKHSTIIVKVSWLEKKPEGILYIYILYLNTFFVWPCWRPNAEHVLDSTTKLFFSSEVWLHFCFDCQYFVIHALRNVLCEEAIHSICECKKLIVSMKYGFHVQMYMDLFFYFGIVLYMLFGVVFFKEYAPQSLLKLLIL